MHEEPDDIKRLRRNVNRGLGLLALLALTIAEAWPLGRPYAMALLVFTVLCVYLNVKATYVSARQLRVHYASNVIAAAASSLIICGGMYYDLEHRRQLGLVFIGLAALMLLAALAWYGMRSRHQRRSG